MPPGRGATETPVILTGVSGTCINCVTAATGCSLAVTEITPLLELPASGITDRTLVEERVPVTCETDITSYETEGDEVISRVSPLVKVMVRCARALCQIVVPSMRAKEVIVWAGEFVYEGNGLNRRFRDCMATTRNGMVIEVLYCVRVTVT